jgi:hypothetical protein
LIDEGGDTLHIHGDTLYSTARYDSVGNEFRLMKIFFGVRFFRSDMQGSCDSLSYSTADSTFRMYREPIMWDESTQITGDTIYLLTKNNRPDTLKVLSKAFMISKIDSTKHNQVSGRSMLGKFGGGELRRVYVNGNGQTIYYPEEEDGDFIGMNRSLCSNLLIHFAEKKVKRIVFLKMPEGKLYPLPEVTPDLKHLEGFRPLFDQRPKSKKDLF